MDSTTIEQMIRAALPDAHIRVTGDDGVHFEAEVISPEFAGKSTLQQHRLVYAALGDKMGHDIHALSLKTRAPRSDSD